MALGQASDAVGATKAAAPGLTANNINVTVVETCTTPPAADSNAKVQATYPFQYDIPLFRSATITLTVTGVMRCGD